MTTTIRCPILEGNLLSDGAPTRAAVERLANETCSALETAFPGARVECPISWRTQGVVSYQVSGEADEDDVRMIANRVWEQWCRNLSDADIES